MKRKQRTSGPTLSFLPRAPFISLTNSLMKEHLQNTLGLEGKAHQYKVLVAVLSSEGDIPILCNFPVMHAY